MKGRATGMRLVGRGLAVSMGILVLAWGAVTLDWRLLVPIGLGLPLVAVVVWDELARDAARAGASPHSPSAGIASPSDWLLHESVIGLALALWFLRLHVLLFAVPGVFGTLARSGVRIAVHALPLMIVVQALRRGWPGRVPRPALLLGAFTLFAVASVTWSRDPAESAERAVQWALVVGLTLYCSSRAATEPGFVDRLLARFLRYISWGALGLATWGVATGFLSADRFSWPWQHPNVAAALLLVPCIGLLFHPRRSTISWPLPWGLVVVVLAAFGYATASRLTAAAAIVALACGWFVVALRDSRVGGLGLGVGLLAIGLVAGVAADAFSAWLHRGQATETVVGLNGRVELWRWALDNPLGSEIWGVGVGAAQATAAVSWEAEHLHSSWIDFLQTLGVIGLALMGGVVVACVLLVVSRRSPHAAWLLGFVIVISIAEFGFAGPRYSLIMLCLAIVAVSGLPAHERRPSRLGPTVPGVHVGVSAAPRTRKLARDGAAASVGTRFEARR